MPEDDVSEFVKFDVSLGCVLDEMYVLGCSAQTGFPMLRVSRPRSGTYSCLLQLNILIFKFRHVSVLKFDHASFGFRVSLSTAPH